MPPWKFAAARRENSENRMYERERSRMMEDYEKDTEELRQKLLREVYAGGIAGFGAMLLDESEIRHADKEELECIARRYGFK